MDWKAEINRYVSEISKLKVSCKCGHREIMPVFVEKCQCSYCGRTLHNNTRLHFKYRMRKELSL